MNKRRKSISLGDKIFARVTRNGQTIFNYVSEKVANMTQLINELRMAMKDTDGLVMIHIRNYHQGWGEERPLMLYAASIRNNRIYSQQNPRLSVEVESRMLFPWETH